MEPAAPKSPRSWSNFHRRWGLPLLLCAAGLTACSGSPGPGDSTAETATLRVGPAGGVLELKAATLRVPPGALASDVDINCKWVGGSGIPSAYQPYSELLSCGPAGLAFDKPVIASLRLSKNAPTDVALFWSDDTGGYQRIGGGIEGEVLSAAITHFSSGFAGKAKGGGTASTADAGADATGGDSCGESCRVANGQATCRTPGSGDYRTQTQGGWGIGASGDNPGVYRNAQFPQAFPSGLTIGCAAKGTVRFTSSLAVENFLPAGGTGAALAQSYVDPLQTGAGVLAGQVTTLSLSVGFDAADPSFGGSADPLGALILQRTTCAGMTVSQVLQATNEVLGGCAQHLTPSQAGECADAINNSFVDGTQADSTLYRDSCRVDCDPGYANCDGDIQDGCETSLLGNPAHCGGCNVACAADASCNVSGSSSSCVCAPGFRGNGVICEDINECADGSDRCAADALCINTPGDHRCQCPAGFAGDGVTCVDVDECAAGTDRCNDNAACTNTVGAYTCACAAGFQGNGFICQDVDECAEGTDSCDARASCNNTVGAYTCACLSGYEGNGRLCRDIDECKSGGDRCQVRETCTNSEGSYSCACEGACQAVDECALGQAACDPQATCTDTPAHYSCACKPGYTGNGFVCADIDECETGQDTCGAGARCENTVGSFQCSCKPGYVGDGITCREQDECALGLYVCADEATCGNTLGSYDCSCRAGYTGNGFICRDKNECATGSVGCHEQAGCVNSEGSFSCVCGGGYQGDGQTCADVDECQVGSDSCDAAAVCSNQAGGFSCACPAGYTGDGRSCTDVDECEAAAGVCDAQASCKNTGGSYACACNVGFAGDGKTCADIDECATGTAGCAPNAACSNTVGGYLCSCAAGYLGDGKTCTPLGPCSDGSNTCAASANCVATGPTEYTCTCKAGYTGDGRTCVPVSPSDPCTDGTQKCSAQATCQSTGNGEYTCTCNPGFGGDGRTCKTLVPCEPGSNTCSTDATCQATGPGLSSCKCKDGYEGDGVTCLAVDPCTGAGGGHDCDEKARCSSPAPGQYRCTCEAGFEGDGKTCRDVDECADGTPKCDANAVCSNSDGGYRCACKDGFGGDGKTCKYVDECERPSSSTTTSSLSCACAPGFRAASGGGACQEIDECAEATDNCDANASCRNTVGAFTCACTAPYEGDGITCSVPDPCARGTDACDDNAACTATGAGSYDCACRAGYRGDGRSCRDVDECAEGTDNCAANATCKNLDNGFACTCNAGYTGDGVQCATVGACAGNNPCAANASCSNVDAENVSCTCGPGFAGDGRTCTDIDECAQGTDNCGANASCTNTPGGFACACAAGHSGDGYLCSDTDECAQGSNDCDRNATCTNSPASFSCACKPGFTGNGRTCLDVDECATGADACDAQAICSNTPGGYGCACPALYRGDGRTCTRIGHAVAIAAGGGHTCALMSTAGVRCWGWGLYGELGYGNTKDLGDDEAPSIAGDVPLGEKVAQVAVGIVHACALLTDGSVRCWGRNHYGALGYGHTRNVGDDELPSTATPVQVGGRVVQLAAGGEHTCALLEGGRVRCWGLGINGQTGLGNFRSIGDDESPIVAAEVALGASAKQLVAGRDHTCALLDGGRVRCWGRGQWGQLGYGHTRNVGDDESPAAAGDVNVGATVKQLAAGWYHTCALLDSGSVRCWGFGNFGQLGTGSVNSIGDDEPAGAAAPVTFGSPVSEISAGAFHTCARLADGSVQCWGDGRYGQTGLQSTANVGDDEPVSHLPAVRLEGKAIQIATGSYHSCALLEAGTVRCWGQGQEGRLGYGDLRNSGDDEPPAYSGDVPLESDRNECKLDGISCGANKVCINTIGGYDCACGQGYRLVGGACVDIDECATGANRCDANATCSNSPGSHTCSCRPGFVGDGSWCSTQDACLQNQGSCDVNATCKSESSGASCSCKAGYLGDGRTCREIDECQMGLDECDVNAACQNTSGGYTCQCRDGFTGNGKVCSVVEVTAVSAGGNHTCALLDTKAVRCWGQGAAGQLGYGNPANVGLNNTTAALNCEVDLGGKAEQVVTGGAHTCARLEGGKVRCWGDGRWGQLGYRNTQNIGDDEMPATAGDVQVGGTVVQLAAGKDHTCALLQGGTVRCWGRGESGRLGYGHTQSIGDNEHPSEAGDVQVGGTVKQISAGTYHTCAVLTNGAVRCWGGGYYGRLGYGRTDDVGDNETPATAGDIDVGGPVREVVAGEVHTCALLETGGVRCWGLGVMGRLGAGDSRSIGDDETPAQGGAVALLGPATKLSATAHTCAVLQSGAVQCWGPGLHGRLGYGTIEDIGDNELPTAAGAVRLTDGAPSGATAIAAGGMHSCALLANHQLRCWGNGADGQLGYGNTQTIGDDETPASAGEVPVVRSAPRP